MISETGISIYKVHKPLSSGRGFTIMEILVVVTIISIIASVIVLNTDLNRPESNLKTHSTHVQKILRLLMQEAILEDRNFALSILPDQYLVLEYDGQGWNPSGDKLFKVLKKTSDFQDELLVDKHLVKIEKTDAPEPHILILSSGEMSIFEWQIEDRKNRLKVRLTSTMLGQLTLEGPFESHI